MSAPDAKPAGMSRTAAAIAWVENGAEPGEKRRTAYRAAKMLGISQAAISQEIKRRRLRRPVFSAVVISAQEADPRRPGITFPEIPGSDSAPL